MNVTWVYIGVLNRSGPPASPWVWKFRRVVALLPHCHYFWTCKGPWAHCTGSVIQYQCTGLGGSGATPQDPIPGSGAERGQILACRGGRQDPQEPIMAYRGGKE